MRRFKWNDPFFVGATKLTYTSHSPRSQLGVAIRWASCRMEVWESKAIFLRLTLGEG